MTALVTKHLQLVAGAPDGIKKLRALILELAVRGKLVPHDHCESPVGDLLARISLARNSSSTKGKGRRGAPIEQELEPRFDAPTGWQWLRLGDLLTKIGAGSTPLGGKQAYVASGVKFLRSQNVWNEGLRLDEVALISEETHQKMSGTHVEAGDILFNITGASIGRCAIVPDSFDTGNVSQHVTIIRPCIPDICSYLHKVLMSGLVQDTVMAVQVGVSREGLSIGKLAQFPIPLPPLDEQHRIVAKVDELMALCDRLEADQADAEAAHAQLVQALLDSLTQATDAADFRASWQRLSEHFHTLFTTEASIDALKQTVLQLAVMGKLVPQDSTEESVNAFLQRLDDSRSKQDADKAIRSRAHSSISDMMADPPYEAPNGWTWRSFGSLLNITGGVTLGRKLAGRKLISKPYLRVANVQRSYLVLDQIKHVEVPEDEVEKYKLLPNDLLITEGGDWDKVGRTAIWHGEIADCLHQNHVFRARSPSAEFSHRWAELYLNAQPARDYFAGSSKQTTNLASINMTQLRACAFPVPPLPEQHRIVAKVDELMALCDQLKAQLSEARKHHEQLAQALVEQAIS